MVVKAYHYRKKDREIVSDYAVKGSAIGTIGGISAGMLSGFIAPLYFGWKIGEYACDKLKIPETISFAMDLVSACVITSVTCEVSVPVLTITGAMIGFVTGTTIGATTGIVKKGLESILKNKN